MKKLYLAGPMSGCPSHNAPLFHRVAGLLRRQGYSVFNPAENNDGGVPRPRSFYMRLDIPALLQSEAVVVLPGWEESRGASLEVWLALDLEVPVRECVLHADRVELVPLEGLVVRAMPFRPVRVPLDAPAE
jgi:hypothetical protein